MPATGIAVFQLLLVKYGTSTGTCSSNWSDENDLLQERLSKVKTVAGTQKLHNSIPHTVETLTVRGCSGGTVGVQWEYSGSTVGVREWSFSG